jgi:hypothetical protein
VRASYNHAEYMDERKAMMQEWADLLNDPVRSTRKGAASRKVKDSIRKAHARGIGRS